jgi:hypothetical protein
MGVAWATPPFTQPMRGNYGAEVIVLNVWRFGGLGMGQCPYMPQRFGVHARPETPQRLCDMSLQSHWLR